MPEISENVTGPNWATLASHQLWLQNQAESQFAFFEKSSINLAGGFYSLDDDGLPMLQSDGGFGPREIHVTTRMVHSFAIAQMMGRPGAARMIDHGMAFLMDGHRDSKHGGYLSDVAADGSSSGEKQAYGHAFVLLAASSAKAVGHPDGDRLLADISQVIRERFWEEKHGAIAEEFTRDWQPLSDYRGQNSNMHMVEALMGAFEVSGDNIYLEMAERIADMIIARHAAACNWRLPEHFSQDWALDRDYDGDPVFRPAGTTPGHWLEWARLLVQLWVLGGRKQNWMCDAAKKLFSKAVSEGWNSRDGGFYYTLNWDGEPSVPDRYWWPCCEGIAAAHFLTALTGDQFYEAWYRRLWNFAKGHFIDGPRGGWYPQIDGDGLPSSDPFFGKVDIYHSLQATVIPLVSADGSVMAGLAKRA